MPGQVRRFGVEVAAAGAAGAERHHRRRVGAAEVAGEAASGREDAACGHRRGGGQEARDRVEPLAPPEEVETVAREAGIRVETLDPIEGLTEDEAERGKDYFSLMRANLAKLREALGCR